MPAMQIRAQLAAEGHPLFGDTLYEPLAMTLRPSSDASHEMARMSIKTVTDCQSMTNCSGVDSEISLGQTVQVPSRGNAVDINERENFNAHNQEDAAGAPDRCAGSIPVRVLNEPLASGIGLQACRLVVHANDNIMGSSPAVFEAPVPWWREGV